MARAEPQARSRDAANEDGLDADRLDPDLADRLPLANARLERASTGEQGGPVPGIATRVDLLEPQPLDIEPRVEAGLAPLGVEAALLHPCVGARDGFLPDDGQPRVRKEQDAGDYEDE